MSDSFLPADYDVPSGGAYMTFDEGENKFRVIARPVLGYELWSDSKPIRRPMGEDFTQEEKNSADINTYTGEKGTPVHFWAMPVWNYKSKQIEVLKISQKTIQEALVEYIRDPEWGDLTDYDVIVVKKTKPKVNYQVKPRPKAPLHKDIVSAKEHCVIEMDMYFANGNPIQGADASLGDKTQATKEVEEVFGVKE